MRTPRRPTGSGPREPAVERLSDRELEIFNLLGQGRRSAEIATLLHLSVKLNPLVDTHRANMREKLDLPNGAAPGPLRDPLDRDKGLIAASPPGRSLYRFFRFTARTATAGRPGS